MAISYINKNSAVGKVVQLTGVTAGHPVVSLLVWGDGAGTPTISDGSSSWSYATVKLNSAQYLMLAYTLSSVASGTVNYTWTAAFGGSWTAHVIEISSGGALSLDTIDAQGTGTGSTATSGNETSTETSMVAFGAAGFYHNGAYTSATLDGTAVDQATSIGDAGGDWGGLTMRVMNNPGTYNSAITYDGGSAVWVADLIAFKEAAVATAALSGTATASITEADIV